MTDRVALNVGGTMFFTTKGTLCAREGMFSAMFSGRHKLADEDEQFIDRDPTHFKLILNYLRNGTLVLPACPGHLNELLLEAQYYCLEDLAQLVQERLKELEAEAAAAAARPNKRRRISCSTSSGSSAEEDSDIDDDFMSWEALLLSLVEKFARQGRFRTKYGDSQAKQQARANLLRMAIFERRHCMRIALESFKEDEEGLVSHLNLLATEATNTVFNGLTHVMRGFPA